jgi:hypothetical protein
MKNLYFLLLLLGGLYAHPCQAQTQSIDSVAQKLSSVFANVDKSQVPTQYLYEAGLRFLDLNNYRGKLSDSSVTDQSILRYLRVQLASSRVAGTDTLPQTRAYNARMDAALNGAGGAIPLTVQCMRYASIRPDALQQNLLRAQNEQLFDVAGRTSSPYQSKLLFAAAPILSYSRNATVSFIFRRNLLLTNNGLPTSIYLDFGDGSGYQFGAWNQYLTTTYESAGTKRIKVMMYYPRTPTLSNPRPGGDFLESWFDFDVLTSGSLLASTANSSVADLEVPFASPNNAHSGGTAFIVYGNSPGGSKHTQLTKPFIISEGYNLYDIAPSLRKCNNPNNDVDDFFNKINVNFNDLQGNVTGNFRANLLNAGYDIVYIDNARGTDDIIRNAQLFEDVVRWVNSNKVGGTVTGEQNVVMGQSMGGLVSRYGLAEMTKRGNDDPHTRLLVLHDSPQRGANNPVGLQSLSRATDTAIIGYPGLLAFSLADLVPTLTDAVRVLNQPATQQLSIYNAFNGRGDIRPNTFLTPYHQMVDYPAPYPVVAVSDGSQCGRAQNTPAHVTISESDLKFFLRPMSIIGDFGISGSLSAYGLPNYGQQDVVSRARFNLDYRLCFGGVFCIPIHFSLINQSANSPVNAQPLEILPGGNTNPKTEAGSCGNIDFGSLPGLYAAYVRTNLYDGPICFVPSYSSLDVPTVTPTTAYAKYINNITDNPSTPLVRRYIGQEAISGTQYNVAHIRFTPRNSEWIYDEMERLPYASNYCATECLALNISSTLPAGYPLCNGRSATYSLSNVPAGASITWSATPAQYFTTSMGSGPTFTTSQAAGQSAYGNITATVTVGTCQTQASTTVAIGSAAPIGRIVYNGVSRPLQGTNFVTSNTQITLILDQPQSFVFTCNNPAVGLSSNSNSTTFFISSSGTNSTRADITATATDASTCLSGTYFFIAASYYSFAPNPANTELTVTDSEANLANLGAEPFEAELYDNYGRKVKNKKSEQGKAVIDVRDLPDGLYNLRVGKGKKALNEHVQITH